MVPAVGPYSSYPYIYLFPLSDYIRAFYTSRNNARHTLTRACVPMMLQSNPIILFAVWATVREEGELQVFKQW